MLSRSELIAALFRETDRAQRMKTSLTVVLCGIDGWEQLGSRIDRPGLEEVEQEIVRRIVRDLRCYDLIGRYGDGELAVILPGCNSFSAVPMAERLGRDVFGPPVRAGVEESKISAWFGVAGSGGRSPMVVLRNVELALKRAKEQGAGTVVRCSNDTEPDPRNFLVSATVNPDFGR